MKKILLHLIFLLSVLSCSKDETDPTPSQNNSNGGGNNSNTTTVTTDKNTLIGRCTLFDYINYGIINSTGITVKILGNNSEVVIQTSTNSSGDFIFTNLPVGTYDIEYSFISSNPNFKYSTIRRYSVYHGSGPMSTMVYSANIFYQPTSKIEQVSLISGKLNEFSANITPMNQEVVKKLSVGVLYKFMGSQDNFKQFLSGAYSDSLGINKQRLIMNYPSDWKGKSVQLKFYFTSYFYLGTTYQNEYNTTNPYGTSIKDFMGPLSNEVIVNP